MTHGEVAAAGGMPRAARVIASLADAPARTAAHITI